MAGPEPRRSRVVAVMALAAALLLTACTGAAEPPPPSPTATPTADAATPRTLEDLLALPAERPVLEDVAAAAAVAGETARQVAYESAGARVTAVLRTPAGAETSPAVVVVHGSVDPTSYVSGGDLLPEQRALLAAGFAVLAIDMRGYAGSDPAATAAPTIDPGFGWGTTLDWGMALDVVNALRALRTGAVDGVDADRIGLLGHSLGGLLALDAAVIAPGAADLVVALASAPSDFRAAIEAMAQERPDLADDLDQGLPPGYWEAVSPRAHFDRVTEPLLMIHGAADDVVPAAWSEETARAWEDAGPPADLVVLPGADHHFAPNRDEAVALTVAAFHAVLR
ncbi:alpha/beta hydrolase family protein [Microbacterium sediminis]|uniref:Peptidase S9 prolyl oligopeptidase catalytic domain-containing protein n=1 Tax=Microbacterium sediminis TaxID=904291 RepID=A0A1B9NGP4_9MICO|nr:alpha/beta fold hydrolase [Microbacterium sediminis]OCG75768.1 hypothetical protein A7J15_01600 [Microbacterium sediminis]QBR74161.1 alpha/beta fold hydrolase [Microbacterium sediminis]